jgi:hypothetical protein
MIHIFHNHNSRFLLTQFFKFFYDELIKRCKKVHRWDERFLDYGASLNKVFLIEHKNLIEKFNWLFWYFGKIIMKILIKLYLRKPLIFWMKIIFKWVPVETTQPLITFEYSKLKLSRYGGVFFELFSSFFVINSNWVSF